MLDSEEWDRVVDVNLKGTFLCGKYAIAQMLEQGSGNVINVASVEEPGERVPEPLASE